MPGRSTLPVGALLALLLSGPALAQEEDFVQQGQASWYGPGFHGKKAANGERFDQNEMTAAHRTLPLGTEATVTNLENGKQVEVEITDRGPYKKGRVLDLSKAAAERIDMTRDGTASVRIEVDKDGEKTGEPEAAEASR